jgi:IclR family KDG regulon transcriptional repressor
MESAGRAAGDGMVYTISAVDRALALLEAIAVHPGIGVTELAERTGQTKSLIFRLIYTLQQRGYVIKDPVTRTYTLGYRTLYLASNATDQLSVLRAAEPLLDMLAHETKDNINLLVRDGVNSVCLAVREQVSPYRLYGRVGRRGPLHAGGGPKILLAFAPEDVVAEVLAGPLERFTPTTVTDPDKLARSLGDIRATGFNESHGDIDPQAFSFAAAVRDATGAVAATLSIAGRDATLTPALTERYRRLVRDYAQRISAALGYRTALRTAV